MMTNYRKWIIPAMLLVVIFMVQACSTVPITGRKQLNLIPQSDMLAMSFSNYDEFLKENKLSTDQKNTELVKNVGKRIAAAVEQFMSEKGISDRVANFSWEFNLVDDDTPNAWCMPGGKVVVYSGILPLTRSETGLAVVMGHEIAHAIARHGNERMSQQMGIELGGMALATALEEKPAETQNLFMTAYGVGSQVGVILPYSRSHETEADKLGLIFMAMAGYNPEEAIDFWTRMSQTGGQKPPEFLSTHPADNTRVSDLKAYMPEALKYYKK